MVKGKKKVDAKTISQQKRSRRKWVTFLRMCRYGVNNFTRNAWLTVASTAIMTITLLVIFVSVISQHVMSNTLDVVRDSVRMSIYLENETSPDEVSQVVAEVKNLESVINVETQSPNEARDDFIAKNKSDPSSLEAVKEATNQFFWTLKIKVADINDTSELASYVETSGLLKEHIDPNHEPSFKGDRREAIEKIASTAAFAQNIGIIVSVVFVAISTLIIFNTIRMAIFNRREEIQMMKLIGAERSFIRGPFIVEAVVYGFFAAILASVIGFALFIFSAPWLEGAGVSVAQTEDALTIYAGFVLLAMIIAGAIIGIISSLLATHRYLRGH